MTHHGMEPGARGALVAATGLALVLAIIFGVFGAAATLAVVLHHEQRACGASLACSFYAAGIAHWVTWRILLRAQF